jgi:hypothetical protein
MRRTFEQTLPIVAFTIILAGCCTAGRATHWEYKVAEPAGSGPNNTRQSLEPFLNDMAKDGWIFIERDNTGWCYFKRPKQ